MNPYYKEYSEWLAELWPGMKVQKLSVNTGHSCPNRDGTIGIGGCIYCNNASFTPGYCFDTDGIAAQLEAGKRFFGRKYPAMKYLAYFQSFTSTHRGETLASEIDEALGVDGMAGIVIGTRPDCLDDGVLEVLKNVSKRVPVIVELGIESLHDDTLRLINRGHGSSIAIEGIRKAADAGLHVGVHLIMGLPGEDEAKMLESLERICREPVETVKLHQLQVLKGSELEKRLERGELEIAPFSLDGYLEFCVKAVGIIPGRIAIERFTAQAPPGMVVTPKWGIKNHEFTARLLKRLKATKPQIMR